MKIWTVTTQVICKGDDTGIETQVCTNKNLALEFLRQYKQEDYEAAVKGWGWRVVVDTDEDYECYPDDDWLNNHSCCYIREFEV